MNMIQVSGNVSVDSDDNSSSTPKLVEKMRTGARNGTSEPWRPKHSKFKMWDAGREYIEA
jgi:hypothetical protein